MTVEELTELKITDAIGIVKVGMQELVGVAGISHNGNVLKG